MSFFHIKFFNLIYRIVNNVRPVAIIDKLVIKKKDIPLFYKTLTYVKKNAQNCLKKYAASLVLNVRNFDALVDARAGHFGFAGYADPHRHHLPVSIEFALLMCGVVAGGR